MSAWVLPDDVADALPSAARQIEELRRQLLDIANGYGYELVIPPLLEFTDSLLSGSGANLDLLTFKLLDQLSGRTMGVRADTTPQVARIDAHLLNREGVTRLCYVGPVLHTRSDRPYATREPLQFGAEIYGYAELDADIEVVDLAVRCVHQCGVQSLRLDLADVRLVQAIMLSGQACDGAKPGPKLDKAAVQQLHHALAAKDIATLREMLSAWREQDYISSQTQDALLALPRLYGGVEVLEQVAELCKPLWIVQDVCPGQQLFESALEDLRTLHDTLAHYHPHLEIGYDLSDLQGYDYYTASRFALYSANAPDSLARGGRYDEIGAAFGRRRPAAGFSLDIKELLQVLHVAPLKRAIRAPWLRDKALHAAVAALREQGETVVYLPQAQWDSLGKEEVDEFSFDRSLVKIEGDWKLQAI